MLAPMPRRARRAAGAVRLAGLVLGAVATTSCGGVGQPATYDPTGVDGLVVPTPSPDPVDFAADVDNPWFLPSSGPRLYVVEEGGEEVGTVRVEAGGEERVAGLEATSVVTRTQVGGEERSTTTRWYAQDESGNVWLVGEDTDRGVWRAGEAGARAGLAMPAEPRLGDAWVTAKVPGAVADAVRVDETDPATVRTTEVDGDGTRTENVYAAGRGLVESVTAEGRTTRLVDPPASLDD
jgi:hypothetical protein